MPAGVERTVGLAPAAGAGRLLIARDDRRQRNATAVPGLARFVVGEVA